MMEDRLRILQDLRGSLKAPHHSHNSKSPAAGMLILYLFISNQELSFEREG